MFFKPPPRYVSSQILSKLEQPPKRCPVLLDDDLYINAVLDGNYRPLNFSESTRWLLVAKLLLEKLTDQTSCVYDGAGDFEIEKTDDPDPTPPNGGEKVFLGPATTTDSEILASFYHLILTDAA